MADQQRVFDGRWRVVRKLGKGGQGVVYEVEDLSGARSETETLQRLKTALRDATAAIHHMSARDEMRELLDVIRGIASTSALPRAALKELLPVDEAVNADKALERMNEEIEAMKAVHHPALIRIRDSKLSEGWFVMDYFPRGPLSGLMTMFEGRVAEALAALRPIVDGVAQLHAEGIVHRDIKPDNVYVADGDRLVLGDCGLAIRMEKEDRLTNTYENAGSRDWMPGWAQGMRVEDVKPNFDVFSIGKLLWSMISGKPRLRLWYHRRPDFDLGKMFADDPAIPYVQRILDVSVVEEPDDCLPNATELLHELDDALAAVRAGGQLPTDKRWMRCRFCRLGRYQKTDGSSTVPAAGYSAAQVHTFRCESCGHLDVFLWDTDSRPPKLWQGPAR